VLQKTSILFVTKIVQREFSALNTSVSVLCNIPGEYKVYWNIFYSFTSSVSSGKDLLHNICDHYPPPPTLVSNILQSRLVALLELKAKESKTKQL